MKRRVLFIKKKCLFLNFKNVSMITNIFLRVLFIFYKKVIIHINYNNKVLFFNSKYFFYKKKKKNKIIYFFILGTF